MYYGLIIILLYTHSCLAMEQQEIITIDGIPVLIAAVMAKLLASEKSAHPITEQPVRTLDLPNTSSYYLIQRLGSSAIAQLPGKKGYTPKLCYHDNFLKLTGHCGENEYRLAYPYVYQNLIAKLKRKWKVATIPPYSQLPPMRLNPENCYCIKREQENFITGDMLRSIAYTLNIELEVNDLWRESTLDKSIPKLKRGSIVCFIPKNSYGKTITKLGFQVD